MRHQSSRAVFSPPSPIRAAPCPYPLFPLPRLLPFEVRWPLLQKRLRAFAHIFRRASHSEQCRLQEQAFFLRHFHAALDRLHGEFHGERPVGDNLFRHRFRGGNQLRRLVNMIDQSDALRFFRRDHFAGKAKFVRHALASQPPPSANPLIAQIDGFPIVSSKWKTLWPKSENSFPFTGVCNASSLISAPATNAFSPAPVRISTRTAASSRASSNACCNSSTVLRFSALSTFGRLKVMYAIPSFFSYKIFS